MDAKLLSFKFGTGGAMVVDVEKQGVIVQVEGVTELHMSAESAEAMWRNGAILVRDGIGGAELVQGTMKELNKLLNSCVV